MPGGGAGTTVRGMADEVAGQDRWMRRKPLIWRRVGDEAVILDADNRVLRGLNLTGWHIWCQLDGDRTLDDVSADLAQNFAIPREQASHDVTRFVEELSAAGLIEKAAS